MSEKLDKKISDNPSTAEIKTLLPAIELVSKVTGVFSSMGNKGVETFKSQTDELLEQAKIIDIPDKFNDAFSDDGWIATGSLSMELMQTALQLYDSDQKEDAIQLIINWFDEDNIRFRLRRARQYHAASLRDDQLMEALNLYLEERYMAAVPLILIACDGMASDVAGFNPFNIDADLSCFDSIVGHEKALPKLMEKLRTGIRKSSNEAINLPLRNGILHGRSLGYANKEIAAKAWLLFIALADWAADKQTEEERIAKYEEQESVTFSDSIDTLINLRKDQRIISSFESYEKNTETFNFEDQSLPEAAFQNFFENWKVKNFGKMGEFAMNPSGNGFKKQAASMRTMTEFVELHDFELIEMRQSAVARAEAKVKVVARTLQKEVVGLISVLAFRHTPDGKSAMPDEDASWLIQQNCIYSVMNGNIIERKES